MIRILVLALGFAAAERLLSAQATDPGELKYLQATGVFGFVTPPAGTSDMVTFEYVRSGFNIKLQLPRKTTAGTLSSITGLLTLKEAVPIRIEVTGTAQIEEILTVQEPTSSCRVTQLVRRGAAVNIPLSCSLNRLNRTNTSAGHAVWNLELVSTERPKLFVATPHYSIPFPPAGCPAIQATKAGGPAEDLVCTPPDIAIDTVTAIQVIQDKEGRIPLVPGKATVVRVFSKSMGASPRLYSITGTLMVNGDDDGCRNRVIPTNDRFGMAVVGEPDHGNAAASIEFLLPPECTKAGLLGVAAEISMTDPEVNKENNRFETLLVFPKALEFVPLTLDYWSVCVGNQWCPEMYDAHERIQMMLPIGDGRANFTPIHMLYPPLTWPGIKSFSDFENFARLQLFLDRIMTRLRGAGSVYKLWTAVPGGSPEILRNFDLSVFDWCQTDRDCYSRNAFEFAESMVNYLTKRLPLLESPPEIVAHYNARTNEVLPASSFPLREGGWITAQQYVRTIARLVTITEGYNAISGPPPPPPPATEVPVAGAPANPVTPEAPASEVETLVITGFVRRDGSSARLEPAFRNSLSAADPSDANGKWCLRARRPGQQGDTETCFVVDFSEGSEQAPFAVEIPWYADLSTVTLIHRDAPENELARLNAGDPIELQITSPRAGDVWEGRQSLAWSGVEPAGRSLTYMVLYSPDSGQTWLPLATDWTDSTLPIDTARLAGGKEVRLRVVASSGLTNAVVDVGPFEIRQRPQLRVVTGPLADLGNRRPGEAAQMEIRLRNEGTGPLSLGWGIPGGVPFTLPFEAAGAKIVVPAGQERKVTVRYWPQSAGQHQGELTFSGNGVEERVTLQGAAYDRAVPGIVVPASFDFGRLAVGSTRELPFAIRNAGEAALMVQSLVSGSSAFQIVTPVSGIEIAPGGSAAVMVRVRVTTAAPVTGRLTIRSNDPRLAAVEVTVSATGIVPQGGSIDLAPGTLDFGNVAVNSVRTVDLTIANLGTAPLTIHSVASSSARFTLTSPPLPVTIAPGAQRVAVVRFAPVAAGSETATLVIASDDPAMATAVVNLRGAGTGGAVATPAISVSASSLDFGSVTQGSSAARTLTISNTGNAVLAVSSLAVTAPFTVSPASIASIAAGGSTNITVTFAPTAAGAVSRSLSIVSNDPARGAVTVALSGTGAAAPVGPPANFAGQWTTTSSGFTYTLNITQTGANVTGTYPQFNGTIAGTVSGNTLRGTWSQPGSAGTLEFVLASDGNSFSGTWTATSGASNSGTWTGVRAAAAGNPAISVSATTIDFGSVTPGTSATRTLTISNTGSAALAVTSLATSAPFVVSPPSIGSIAPGGSSNVSVSFLPNAAGSVSRSLTITSNDPVRNAVTVTLNGAGTATSGGPAGNFAGQWTATSGGVTYTLNITQTGANVTGTYPQYNGTVNGTVSGNTLNGNWTDQSGSGTFVFNLAADGNTFSGTWVRTSAGGGNGTWTGVRVNTGGTVLSIDDGTFENVIGFPQGGSTAFFVNRLTPARYPATLRAVQIRFPLGELPAGTAFSVIASAHTSGAGGTPLTNVAWQSTAAQIVTVGQFVEYTIPAITINSGDFLVGFSVANPANIWPASLDSTPPARTRSYVGTSATSIRYPADANQGNLGIRARVE